MSDPIERSALGLRRRKSTRISDADAATAAVALAGVLRSLLPLWCRQVGETFNAGIRKYLSAGEVKPAWKLWPEHYACLMCQNALLQSVSSAWLRQAPHCLPLSVGLTGKPAPRLSRSMSPDQSMSAGTSVGRRNSGRSGPVASDQAKSSAYKGVSWHKHSQKWYAYIQSGGKMRGLGYFDSQADAAQAYDAEARKVPFPAHALHVLSPHAMCIPVGDGAHVHACLYMALGKGLSALAEGYCR